MDPFRIAGGADELASLERSEYALDLARGGKTTYGAPPSAQARSSFSSSSSSLCVASSDRSSSRMSSSVKKITKLLKTSKKARKRAKVTAKVKATDPGGTTAFRKQKIKLKR